MGCICGGECMYLSSDKNAIEQVKGKPLWVDKEQGFMCRIKKALKYGQYCLFGRRGH